MSAILRLFVALACVAAAALPSVAVAQGGGWPARPLRMIVPFGPGSPPDVLSRLLARSVGDSLGQQLVVENRVGAGGTIGSEVAAKSPADGYTLMLGSTSTLVIAPALYANLAYRPDRDFAPVILAASAPFFVLVHPSLGVNTLKELIDLSRARPGQLSYGSTGNGTPLHIAGAMFRTATGVDIVHVPYKETGPVNNDFLAGRIQVMFQQLPTLVHHIRAGKVKPLAVAASRRDPQVPDVPTTIEAGLPSYQVSSWFGVVAPRGVPPEVLRTLNAQFRKALDDAEVRDTLTKLGFETVGGTPEQFGAFISTESVKWSEATRASGAKLD